ncbi:hypothetical protein PHYSODRAFT_253901 [Phytophthora sojae]|uniref:Uncharacterized protein n=1 Tax=Phytophthora sojae (strain P6497) TaxID=1094619 RepID=G5AAX5_PHYSP|nr:hypothetical protein PHYSODRAFT_253901 [Phytophthora sojae]EGZ07754.1 hypothetical protein PHYSODRAFT_253901 [Phytophthora sojae]|eukprot:XP_009537320.1 hypothetical protein PHYSODRAFT_253901 [Phytophthora sojae]
MAITSGCLTSPSYSLYANGAPSSLIRQSKEQLGQVTRADLAIRDFSKTFVDLLSVAQRVRFTHLLANDPAMATAYCGMDDDARRFMVEECVASWSSDHYDRYTESKDSDNYSDGGETKEHSKFIEDDENDETKGSTPRNNNDEHMADMDYADSK